MRRGTYIGPDGQLKGEKALLRPGDPDTGEVLAQFDSFTVHDERGLLAFGWTAFPADSFHVDDEDET